MADHKPSEMTSYVPPKDQRQIDALCDEFERAFRADRNPRIEDYVERLSKSLMDREDTSNVRDADKRVQRGGSFRAHTYDLRSARRNSYSPDNRVTFGFRVARTVSP